jgi:hypothetical protein
MTKEEIHHFKIALGIAGIAVDTELAELIMSIHNAIKEKGSSCSIEDIIEIENKVRFNNLPYKKEFDAG